MDKLRFFLTDDINTPASYIPVFPLGSKEFEDKIEKEEVFYRRQFKGKYKFVNDIKNGITDFDTLIAIENNSIERCRKRFIIAEELCNGSYIEVQRAEFSMNDCDFDLDRCEVDAKVKELDRYSCIKDNEDVEFNVLSVSPVINSVSPQDNPFEFIACRDACNAFSPDCYVGANPFSWTSFYEECTDLLPGTGNVVYNSGQPSVACDMTDTHAIHWTNNTNNRVRLVTLSTGGVQTIATGLGTGNEFAIDGDYVVFTDRNPGRQLRLYRISTGITITIDNAISGTSFGHTFVSIQGDFVIFYDNSGGSGRRLMRYQISTAGLTTIWSSGAGSGLDATTMTHENGNVCYYDFDANTYNRYNIAGQSIAIIVVMASPPQFIEHHGIHITFRNNDTQQIQSYNTATTTLFIVKSGVNSVTQASGNIEYYVFLDQTGTNTLEYYNVILDVLTVTPIVNPNIAGNFAMDNNSDYIVFFDQTTNQIGYWDIDAGTKTDFDVHAGGGAASVLINDFNTIWYHNPTTDDLIDYNIGTGNSIITESTFQSILSFCKNDAGQFMATDTTPNDIQIWNGTKFNTMKIKIWYREVRTTLCIGGVPTPPSGAGWLLEQNNCGTNGTAIYVRSAPAISPTIQITNCICFGLFCFPPTPPTGTGPFLQIGECDPDDPRAFWWELPPGLSYDRGRLVKDVVESMVSLFCPDVTGVVSNFFQWNPTIATSVNYVTNAQTQVNHLTLHQNSDVINPASPEAATIGNITWGKLVEYFARMFEVYYFIDDSNVLHFEHISIIQNVIGLDLTVGKFARFEKNNRKYSYDKSEMSKAESYKMQEQENIDFVGYPIEYRDNTGAFSLCVNDEIEEYVLDGLSTDLSFAQNSPSSIDSSGFFMFANTFNGTNYDVIVSQGFITNQQIINGPLSWSTLMENYLKWNRILPEAEVNKIFQAMNSSKRFKKQKEFKIPLCCDDGYEPEDFMTTSLGVAQVESSVRDFKTNTLKLKLRYV